MKNFIKKLIEKIKTLFSGLNPKYRLALKLAVDVIDAIYAAIDNPLADVLTGLTKTTLDDKALAWLRAYIPEFAKKFKVFASLRGLTDPQEIILKISEILQGMDQDDKNGERLKMAVALAMDITADGKLDWADAVKIIQSLKDKSI